MHKKGILYMVIITCIYCTEPSFLYSMNDENSPYNIRLLPKELQEHILLSHDVGFLKDAINFLGSQPMTFTKPDGHISTIESVALYGDILETKSWYAWQWYTILWNIHTGEPIHTNIKNCKPWEEYKSVTIDDKKAVSIVLSYHLNEALKSTEIWDIQKNKKLKTINHKKNIRSITADDNNYVAMVLYNGLVKIWNIENKKDTHLIYCLSKAKSVAINKDMIIIGLKSGDLEMRDRCRIHEPIHWFYNTDKRPNKVTSIRLHENKILAGHQDGSIKIWDIVTQELLHKLTGPNKHRDIITAMAMCDDVVITGSEDCTAKIWPLTINTQGKTDNNPLLWIMYNANAPQLNFIWRAWQTTQKDEEFIIDLPTQFGTIEKDESPEQTDGRIYFTLPPMIREYLKNRLKIRRQATTLDKVYLAIEKIMTAT